MTADARKRAEEYIANFAGHSKGVVLSQPKSGLFVERPMTKGELAAREVAATISIDIFRHANQAGVCYYEIWRELAKTIDECVQAERDRADAWEAFARHQEHCAVCADDVSECHDGTIFKNSAEAIERGE